MIFQVARFKRLPPIEKKTIILWNEAEDIVYIDTFNPSLIRRLEGLGKEKVNTLRFLLVIDMVRFRQR